MQSRVEGRRGIEERTREEKNKRGKEGKKKGEGYTWEKREEGRRREEVEKKGGKGREGSRS